jgi:hypothetical protein
MERIKIQREMTRLNRSTPDSRKVAAQHDRPLIYRKPTDPVIEIAMRPYPSIRTVRISAG